MSERSLARRIAAAPYLPADNAGDVKLAAWNASLADRDVAAKLTAIFEDCPRARALVGGIAQYSAHLWDLASSEPERLLCLLRSEPDTHFRSILARACAPETASADEAALMRILRRMKSEAALLIAMADIGQIWPIMQVTQALTELADAAIQAAVHHILMDAVRRGKLNPSDPARPEIGSGYVVLAMGKMGAFELNYSSDVDLIVFFDPAAPTLAPNTEAQALYIRITRS